MYASVTSSTRRTIFGRYHGKIHRLRLNGKLSICQIIVWLNVAFYIGLINAFISCFILNCRNFWSFGFRWQPVSGLTVMKQHLLHAQSFSKSFNRCWILICCIESWHCRLTLKI